MNRLGRLVGLALLAAMLGATSSCGASETPEGATTSTFGAREAVLASTLLSPEDIRLLSQEEPLPLARVDYSKFPTDADPSSPSGRAYYVAPVGDDAGPGTEGQPFRTIEAALLSAGSGDKVVVRAGTYQSAGLVVTHSNFLLTNYGNEAVVVEAAGGSTGLSLTAPSQHDVQVRGLTLAGFEQVGVYVGSPDTVHNLVLDGIQVSGSAEGLSGAYEEGVLVDGMLIKGLLLHDIQSIGFQFGVGEGRNVRIVGLYVQMSASRDDDSGLDALAFEKGNNVLIENTIVEGAGGDGIDLKAGQVAVVNSIVRHVGRNGIKLWSGGDVINTVVFDTGADAQVVTEAGTYRLINCTFAYHLMGGGDSYAATFAYGQSAATDVTLLNNVFFAMPSKLYFAPGASVHLDHNVFHGFPDSLVESGENEYGPSELARIFGGSNLYADPGFADLAAFDFHPAEGSLLLGAGTTEQGAPAFDILGAPRLGTNTVGAFQEAPFSAQEQ